ncbi:MAG TPA: hypothetical protein VGB14_01725 [Acidimicrobiales bacterium]
MALLADHSALPKADRNDGGCPPDEHPRFVHLLVEEWAQRNTDDGDKPTAYDTRLRHSDAGKCARMLSYKAAGLPASDPMDLPGVWVTSLGTLLHEHWQAALQRRYPDAQVEVKLRVDGLDASGHADALLVVDGRRIAYELKTVGGYAFKMKVGERGAPEGPSHDHLLQGALNAVALDADELVIGYLATEAISINAAQRRKLQGAARFAAEWTFTRDEFEPLAERERSRMTSILRLVDDGMLAARRFADPSLPVGHEVVDPVASAGDGRWELRRDGSVVDAGTWWACGYCAFRSLCATTRPGRIPIVEVTGGQAA